jgi:hypothetical protein
MTRVIAIPLVTVALTLAACDSNDNGAAESASDEPSSAHEIPGDADPADVRVIDAWVTTLAEGDVEGAAEFFAIPSVAENGAAVLEIESVADARLFNASLPCGAVLLRAETAGDFTTATFRLTERPGPGSCGSGAGGTATTAFVIEDGRIREWRRVEVGGTDAPSRSL